MPGFDSCFCLKNLGVEERLKMMRAAYEARPGEGKWSVTKATFNMTFAGVFKLSYEALVSTGVVGVN
jgi:hypothetical protein